MDNYEFCATWINHVRAGKNADVLDYGCGAGRLVKLLRRSPGVSAFGCDLFYGGGDRFEAVDSHLLDSAIVRRMEGNMIPFDNASFDFVTNNQVMEHVDALDVVLAEIQRVLKPGGMMLSLFPDKGVWREGHCGVPFLHRFPKGGHVRIYYAAAWRVLGFGYHKGNKSVMRWSRDFCQYLDKWTHYRTRQEIDSVYEKYFCDVRRIEDYWLHQRLGRSGKAIAPLLPVAIQKLMVRKLCGMVFTACKQF